MWKCLELVADLICDTITNTYNYFHPDEAPEQTPLSGEHASHAKGD